MELPNASGVKVNMMYPTDVTYRAKLKAFVDYEPVAPIDQPLRGALPSIGILKGKPFLQFGASSRRCERQRLGTPALPDLEPTLAKASVQTMKDCRVLTRHIE